ncbi:MAG: hypothetical protein R2758_05165 [Bacteroidales bacterium]
MTNKGFEILLGGMPVQTSKFTWDISLNMSTNKNKLVEVIEVLTTLCLPQPTRALPRVWATVSGGYGDIYATTYERNESGQMVVTDAGLFRAAAEKKLVGNYQPDWVGGLNMPSPMEGCLSGSLLMPASAEVYSGADAGLDATGVSERSLEYREGGVIIDGVRADSTANTVSISSQQYWGSYSGIGENYIFDRTQYKAS